MTSRARSRAGVVVIALTLAGASFGCGSRGDTTEPLNSNPDPKQDSEAAKSSELLLLTAPRTDLAGTEVDSSLAELRMLIFKMESGDVQYLEPGDVRRKHANSLEAVGYENVNSYVIEKGGLTVRATRGSRFPYDDPFDKFPPRVDDYYWIEVYGSDNEQRFSVNGREGSLAEKICEGIILKRHGRLSIGF